MESPVKVLIIGAHHEEIEVECPNIAAALAMAGCEVTVLNPVGGWNWTFIRNLGSGGRERTVADATAAAAELGCAKVVWDYPVAKVDRYRDEIIDRLAEFLLEYNPQIVLTHWPLDGHADHRLVAHAARHVLNTAADISPHDHPGFRAPREVYAYQTGPSQTYDFIPDLLVKCDDATMARADRAIDCFLPTAESCVPAWRKNFHTKAEYWGNLAGTPAEALKFLGPALPLDGFLLRRVLGDRLIAMPLERYSYNREFQL